MVHFSFCDVQRPVSTLTAGGEKEQERSMDDEGTASTLSRRTDSTSAAPLLFQAMTVKQSSRRSSEPSTKETLLSPPPPCASAHNVSPSNPLVEDDSGNDALLSRPPSAPAPPASPTSLPSLGHDPHRIEVALSFRFSAYLTASALVPLLLFWALGYKVCQYFAMLHGPIAMLSANMCWVSGLFRTPTWWESLIPWVVALCMILAYVNTILDAAPIRSKVIGAISIFCLKVRSDGSEATKRC